MRRQRERPRVETVARDAGAGRGRSVVLGLAVLLAVAAIAVTAWLWRDKPSDLPPAACDRRGGARRPSGDAKFSDRVAGERAATAALRSPAQPAPGVASRTEVPVSQRAILYEEDQADPQTPKAIAGRVIWRLDALNAGQGQPLETVVRGDRRGSGRGSHAEPPDPAQPRSRRCRPRTPSSSPSRPVGDPGRDGARCGPSAAQERRGGARHAAGRACRCPSRRTCS